MLPNEETIQMWVASQKYNGRPPFRYSLAATLYGARLRDKRPADLEQERIIERLMSSLGPETPKPTTPRKRRLDEPKRQR